MAERGPPRRAGGVTTYALDTDTCVHWLRGSDRVEKRALVVGLDHIGVTVVTACELLYGAWKSERAEKNLRAVETLLGRLTVLQTRQEVPALFGQVKADLERRGTRLDDADLLIGAIALAHGRTLVTGNLAHFQRFPDLEVEAWL